jgi:hypothetical protein
MGQNRIIILKAERIWKNGKKQMEDRKEEGSELERREEDKKSKEWTGRTWRKQREDNGLGQRL